MGFLSNVNCVLADVVEPDVHVVDGPVSGGGSAVVFGIVAVLVIAVAAFIIVKVVKGNKK